MVGLNFSEKLQISTGYESLSVIRGTTVHVFWYINNASKQKHLLQLQNCQNRAPFIYSWVVSNKLMLKQTG